MIHPVGETMNTYTSSKSAILSSGIYLPDEIVKTDNIFEEFNSDEQYGIPIDWMSQEMGIKERRMAPINALPSSLATPAAKDAIANCDGLNPDHIDVVIYCGIERDHTEPATAHTVQNNLGLKADMAFDVSNACFGFVDGLRIANNFVRTGTARNVLLVTGETQTKLTHSFISQLKKGMTRSEAVKKIGFFSLGSAAGAVIIGRTESGQDKGFDLFVNRTQSQHHNKCFYKSGNDGEIHGEMLMARIVSRTLALQLSTFAEIKDELIKQKPSFLLTHQVGQRSFDEVAEVGFLPKERMIKSFDVLGNITSATFPVNHHQLMQDNRLKKGDRVYGCYAGSGIVIGQFVYTH